jgi:hypothetical protein
VWRESGKIHARFILKEQQRLCTLTFDDSNFPALSGVRTKENGSFLASVESNTIHTVIMGAIAAKLSFSIRSPSRRRLARAVEVVAFVPPTCR